MTARNMVAFVGGILAACCCAGLAAGAATEPEDILVPTAKVGLSPSYGSIICLKDGRLLWTWGRGGTRDTTIFGTFSSDEGRTWTDPSPLRLDNGQLMTGRFTTSLVRLPSGAIGLALLGEGRLVFHTSRDDGRTWSQGVRVHPESQKVAFTNDRALVLSSGRVVLPVYSMLTGPKTAVGKPRVKVYGAEFDVTTSHMAFSYVIYSDDEGITWKRSENEVFVALEKGTKGIYAAEEPSVVELSDGRLVMFVRTSLGRFYRSYSPDKGVTWLEAEPTPLVGPPAPCSLKRIPGTNDLLVIWTQVSAFEVMQGLYRHRLTCAVSSDGGVTWNHYRNLESLDDTTHVEEETFRRRSCLGVAASL